MENNETFKKLKRLLDSNLTPRKIILIILVILILLLYLGPSLFRLVINTKPQYSFGDSLSRSLSLRLSRFLEAEASFDAHIMHVPPQKDENNFLPYVGNGLIGITLDQESPIYVRLGRSLALPVHYRPVTLTSIDGATVKEAIVTEYLTGVIHRLQSWERHVDAVPIDISCQIYAHRVYPSLLMQDIKVINPSDEDIIMELEQMALGDWPTAMTEIVKIKHGDGEHDYTVISGSVEVPNSQMVIPVSVVTFKVPSSIQVNRKQSTTLHIVTSVNYTNPVPRDLYSSVKDLPAQAALGVLKQAVMGNLKKIRQEHSDAWRDIWQSGFGISLSRAENVLNGDTINATIYRVLSQVSAPLHEWTTSAERKESILRDVAYAEGCYGGLNTLQANNLWSKLDTVDDINQVVSLWLMTLEKQGCHQLVKDGAIGVMQAMLLSLGGLRFKNQHLEFNSHPKDLHRDLNFRRLSYGNATHLNITVQVQEEDYKAVVYVALDRSDRSYYACDAGCLDPPIQLSENRQIFPVKLTDPVTSILYITYDKLHMEELKHTIHVKEVALAPPHHHHVIAMHKHGHKWGGLPTIFWLSIIGLIVIFHLFLFKLVINEYCSGDVKARYRKLSDF